GPLAMAVVFGLLLGGTSSATFTIGVVDADGSETSRSLAGGLVGGGPASADPTDGGRAKSPVTFRAVDTVEAARRQIDDDRLGGAVVIPAGFGRAVTSGRPTSLVVLRSLDRLVSGQVAESVALGLASRFERVSLAATTVAARTGRPPTEADVAAARERPPALALTQAGDGGGTLSPSAYFGASMSILFLFFTAGFAARSLLAERRDGTLARVLATPTSPGQVIAGKTLSVSVLGLAGFATVWAVTSLVFGAHWGNPGAVLALIVATVVAVGGVSTLVSSLGRTEQQADAYTSAVTFVLALLGGNFIGPGLGPDLLRTLARLTPNGWALQAFTDLAAGAATVAGVGTALAVLLGVGLVTGVVGILRVRRVIGG
ncbi:MAG TPA: ABC transporter permease, partial [Frankiaceae bacterium]|nr:ABC transporter permease [Frankiaceae bacterium]